MGKSLVGGKKK